MTKSLERSRKNDKNVLLEDLNAKVSNSTVKVVVELLESRFVMGEVK